VFREKTNEYRWGRERNKITRGIGERKTWEKEKERGEREKKERGREKKRKREIEM
jgi:hypothetical protein